MSGLIFSQPCVEESESKYCFPCVSGLCPLNMDFMTECYPYLDSEIKDLFDELFSLRASIVRDNSRNHPKNKSRAESEKIKLSTP